MAPIPLALLIIVGLVALAGLIAFGIGHKGWNWGTVAAAVLVHIAAAVFLFLAARLVERERVWRTKVRGLESQIAKERDARRLDDNGGTAPIPGQSSIAELEDDRSRWVRALEQVETWHGRFWPKGSFHPPRDDEPARLRFTIPEDAPEDADPFINAGAQLFVFDDTPADNGGRFLGIFRVQESEIEQGSLVLTIAPAAPPGEAQLARWRQEYDNVTAFESLPVDRWLAFHRTPRKPQGDGVDDDVEMTPTPKKDEAEAKSLLKDLEKRLEDFTKHSTSQPKEDWETLAKEAASSPGIYWAAVTFKTAHAMTINESGRDPKTIPRTVRGHDEGDEANADDGTPKAIQFEKGDTADFELSKARELADEGVVEIRDVFYRRPLADVETALQGAMVTVSGGSTLNVLGAFTIRRVLEDEIGRAKQDTLDLRAATDHIKHSTETLEKEQSELREDLPSWEKDAMAAGKVARDIRERLENTSLILSRSWDAVIELGREYDGSMARLQADAEKHASSQR